ncbi:TnsA endonuclease C-terminal domain-containing protein [Fictibacillus phosphorivorans]|uniref:TnsA endonuclease C-terminal domain-containing protein n=1 Tax=Fictibacillus phosphorivorans TaxID=1221500 RepID=UPI00129320BE|nr:TnsA endonuclease C-terminal domain-containing protein [Fictibacillus phosphorivorans]MQR93686.1 heteromeric transposase endonuclease subunit TnsA [Fictibacillus phosphorivorans]
MPVLKHEQTAKKLASLLEQGYGHGQGKNYKPFLDVIRVPSKGRVSRIKGWKTNRVHHFLTDSETRYFYLLEYGEFEGFQISDIREHYPLIEGMNEILPTLDEQLIKRLFNQKSGEPMVLVTTFLITLKNTNGDISYCARSVKDYRQLENSQIIERFEVMNRYWNFRGIDYGIITNREIPIVPAKNIEFIHSSYHLDEYGLREQEQVIYRDYLLKLIAESQDSTIKDIVYQFDSQLNTENGTGLLLYKHLLARKMLKVDMNKPIDLEQPCSEITIVDRGGSIDAFYEHVTSI